MDIKQRIDYLQQFGSCFTIRCFYYQKMINFYKKDKKIIFADKLNELRVKRLEVEFGKYIKERVYEHKNSNKESKMNKIVWVLWWQGNYDEIPMVKMCLKSIEDNLPKNSKMIILTKDNIEEYVKIPSHIMDKVNNGTMSLTHLSDFIRFYLLSEWGGCWLDATVYALRPYNYVFENKIWTIKRNANNVYIPKGRWTTYAMSGFSHNILFDLMKDLLEEYWRRYDVLIDFFLLDLFIELLYRTVPEVKQLLDDIPENNPKVQKLISMLQEKYNEENFRNMTDNTDLYKLSWKIKVESETDRHTTIYGKLLDNHRDR